MAINAGFMGSAQIEGIADALRYESANISAKQELITRDLAMGDWDMDSYAYDKITLGGSISGPVDEKFIADDGIMKWATAREAPCGTITGKSVDLYYFCGGTEETGGFSHAYFDQMLCNSFELSATAGDLVTFNMELVGSGVPVFDNSGSVAVTEARKLVTWEKINLAISGGAVTFAAGTLFQSFSIRVSNNVTPAYSLGQDNLYPAQLIVGMRRIEGSITVYNISGDGAPIKYDGYTADLTSTLTWLDIPTKVQFMRPDPSASAGPITSTINFVGVTHQDGAFWNA